MGTTALWRVREIPEQKGECKMSGSASGTNFSLRSNLETAVPLLWGVSRKRFQVRKSHPARFVELEIVEITVARAQCCFFKDDACRGIFQVLMDCEETLGPWEQVGNGGW